MTPEDAKKLQELLDSKNGTGVSLDLNPKTGKVSWGCSHCGSASIPLSDRCGGGSFFPGFRCRKIK